MQAILVLFTLAITACDPIGYGYVNQLRRPVAVVHHVHGRAKHFTLAAGERRLPGLGDWPGSREEFFDLNGRQIAAISGDEIDKLTPKNIPSVLVVSSSGVTLATREYWDQWQAEVHREIPSRPGPAKAVLEQPSGAR